MQVETISPFELLQRAAEYLGATVCLSSSADVRSTDGRRWRSGDVGSVLARLSVVRPVVSRTLPRWEKVRAGKILASVELGPTLGVHDAAALLTDELHILIDQRSRRL